MKKSFKCISLMLSSLLILGCGSTAFSAATVEDNESIKAIYEKIEKGRTVLYSENNNEIPVEKLNNDTENISKKLPQKYDLRDYGRVSKVKIRVPRILLGICICSINGIEYSLAKCPKKQARENPQDTIDLSEAGQTWYIHSGIVDKSSPFTAIT